MLVAVLCSSCAARAGGILGGPDSGIRGRAMAGPTCPVERSDSPCPAGPTTELPELEWPHEKARVSVPARLARAGHLPAGRTGRPLDLPALRHPRAAGARSLSAAVRAAAIGGTRPHRHIPGA